jgi:hypothetical protein
MGIQFYPDDVPYLILWNCNCGSTRAVEWHKATEAQRAEARLIELSRDAGNEMQGWGG